MEEQKSTGTFTAVVADRDVVDAHDTELLASTAGTPLATYCPGRQTKAKAVRRRKATWLFVTVTDTSPMVETACWTL